MSSTEYISPTDGAPHTHHEADLVTWVVAGGDDSE